MNRHYARELAEKVTNEDLLQMFLNAQDQIKNWNVQSRVNRGMTKGAAFNILSYEVSSPDFLKTQIHILAKKNMIWEFGEYLPNYSPKVKKEKPDIRIVHQEPKFINLHGH
jgi:hypothetical protein